MEGYSIICTESIIVTYMRVEIYLKRIQDPCA
jgi:hypothetical protein